MQKAPVQVPQLAPLALDRSGRRSAGSARPKAAT